MSSQSSSPSEERNESEQVIPEEPPSPTPSMTSLLASEEILERGLLEYADNNDAGDEKNTQHHILERNLSLDDDDDDDEDEMRQELSRLAAAEENLRSELEMLMVTGFNFVDGPSNDDDGGTSFETTDVLSPLHDKSQFKNDDENSDTQNNDNVNNAVINQHEIRNIFDGKSEFGTPTFRFTEEETERHTDKKYKQKRKKKEKLKVKIYDTDPDTVNWDEICESMGIKQITEEEAVCNQSERKFKCNGGFSGIYKCPVPSLLTQNLDEKQVLSQQDREFLLSSNMEYIQPLSSYHLRKIYTGLVAPKTRNQDGRRKGRGDQDIAGNKNNPSSRGNLSDIPDEPLPIRTCTIRIRPDVLCGSVMDSLAHAVMERDGTMVKRQGGHFMAIIPGFWLKKKKKHSHYDDILAGKDTKHTSEEEMNDTKRKKKKRKLWIPPICLDAQLCTKKIGGHDLCERILLIRIYQHANNQNDGRSIPESIFSLEDDNCEDLNLENADEEPSKGSHAEQIKEHLRDEFDNLKDAAHAVYQIESRLSKQQTDENSSSENVSHASLSSPNTPPIESGGSLGSPSSLPKRLLSSPSRVIAKTTKGCSKRTNHKKLHITQVPALSPKHALYLEGAFRFLLDVITELDTRELSYSSLLSPSCQFGMFPSLPTLDVHYCSQVRIACRESMITNLCNVAAGLESYAREMERNCVNFVRSLAEGSFSEYRMDVLPIPELVPLTAYPLDWKPAEVECPPWGQKVMEVLNQISEESSKFNNDVANTILSGVTPINAKSEGDDGITDNASEMIDSEPAIVGITKDGFTRVRNAVKRVINAFSYQDDKEQVARLNRKNMQVMDRMAKMQAFKRESVILIRDSYGCNRLATKSADHFHSMALKASSPKILKDPSTGKHIVKLSDGDSDVISRNSSVNNFSMSFSVSDQIPLLKSNGLIDGASGTCYITAHQMLFATQGIPILGSGTYTLMNIVDVTLQIVEKQPAGNFIFQSSSPVPTVSVLISASNDVEGKDRRSRHNMGEDELVEVLAFIPAMGATKFKTFVDMVQSVIREDPNTLKFTAKGGLIYMGNS